MPHNQASQAHHDDHHPFARHGVDAGLTLKPAHRPAQPAQRSHRILSLGLQDVGHPRVATTRPTRRQRLRPPSRLATAQGLGNRVLTGCTAEGQKDGEVVVDERLGALLRSYRLDNTIRCRVWISP